MKKIKDRDLSNFFFSFGKMDLVWEIKMGKRREGRGIGRGEIEGEEEEERREEK